MQEEFLSNKRQRLEHEVIGFQGENGTKVSGEVTISKMEPAEFRNMFSSVLDPKEHKEMDEAKKNFENYK